MAISLEDINTLFVNAGQPSGGFRMTNELREIFRERGVRDLKFMTLGFFSDKEIWLKKDLAEILDYIGMVNSVENGLRLAPELRGRFFHYGKNNQYVLNIQKIDGDKYEVSKLKIY